ncbi:MAG: DEAD/DEAH box helicase, partial [Patescibacteria group bacterium]
MKLESLIEDNFRLSSAQKSALGKLNLKTLKDLLYYFPSRYESFSERKNISELQEGDRTTIYGQIIDTKMEKTWRRKMSLSQITIGDYTGTIKATWFNQPYIANILKIGEKIALTGKISRGKSGLYIANPSYEKISSYEALGEGSAILAIYPESRGITSRWLRFAIQKILRSIMPTSDVGLLKTSDVLRDPVPEKILKSYHLPKLSSALVFIHAPKNQDNAEVARKRFAFEEIFFIQLSRLKERSLHNKHHSFKVNISEKETNEFIKIFPFELTSAQKKSINHIIEDLKKQKPMSRLLEGDVGSGKTAVAVVASYAITKNGFQVAYMAPTEILAQQHFQSFINYFSQLRLTTKIGLITSSECRKFPSKVNPREATHISRSQLLKWVANGEIPILIGTHSLIQKNIRFNDLALVIIDEQHRFGTRQRAILAKEKA